MKKYIYLLLFSAMFNLSIIGQNHNLFISFGNAFTGGGDMQGKIMEIGYEYKIKKQFAIFGSISQSNLNTGLLLDVQSAGQLILGKSNLSSAILDLYSYEIGNTYNGKFPGAGSISKSNYANYKSLTIGAKFYTLNIGKLNFLLDASCTASKIETVFETKVSRYLILDDKAWFNNTTNAKYSPIILPSILHDHLLDLGFGGGLAIQYEIVSHLKAELNASYAEYLRASQNLSTWSFRIYYEL